MSLPTTTPQIITSHRGITYVASAGSNGWQVQSRRQNEIAKGAIRRYPSWDKLVSSIPAFRLAMGVH